MPADTSTFTSQIRHLEYQSQQQRLEIARQAERIQQGQQTCHILQCELEEERIHILTLNKQLESERTMIVDTAWRLTESQKLTSQVQQEVEHLRATITDTIEKLKAGLISIP